MSIERAREFYRNGWVPIPLHKNSKLPKLPKGHKFLTVRPTSKEFKSFDWNGNIGIVCGKMSNLTVLDVDEPEGLEALLRNELQPENFIVPQVKTPSGTHYYFYNNPKVRTGVAVFGKGVDIRAEGSYVVGPGSIIDGKKYEWFLHPDEAHWSQAPDWMVREDENDRIKHANVDLNKKVSAGERNNAMTSLCGKLLYASKLPDALVLDTMLYINTKHFVPPLDEEEVKRTFSSVRRYHD